MTGAQADVATGSLHIVGLGPGDPRLVSPLAQDVLSKATDIYGYSPYVARVDDRPGLRKHASDNRQELDRARAALTATENGDRAVIVSSGDPGVFAMAAAVFEAMEGEPRWQQLDVHVVPGISAMLAAAAAVGAPLGHDFCAINLSDNLKPWDIIARRLRLAVKADFAIALYNPRSRSRPDQFSDAMAVVAAAGGGDLPIILVRNATHTDQTAHVTTVAAIAADLVDMRTLVIIGSSATRQVGKWLYTPRRVEVAP